MRNLRTKDINLSQSKDGPTFQSPAQNIQGPATGHHSIVQDEFSSSVSPSLDSRSYDKIRQSFKCPRFSGLPKDWKMWDKGFKRYLSIWELDYVLDPSFFDHLPQAPAQRRDSKLRYFVIEESVQGSPLVSSCSSSPN